MAGASFYFGGGGVSVGPDPMGEKEKQLIIVVMRRHSQ